MFEKVLNTLMPRNHKTIKPHLAKTNHMTTLRQATEMYLITGKPMKQPLRWNQMNGIK